MMWITRELAYRCLDANGEPTVIVNDACPGACRSDVAREFDTTLWAIAKGIGSFLLMRPAENGARVLAGSAMIRAVSILDRSWIGIGLDRSVSILSEIVP
jgi:hypothetical protein